MNRLKKIQLQINSILGGHSDTWSLSGEGQFLTSIGIDPELNLGSRVKSSGIISPTRYSKFSDGEIAAAPMWISGAQTTAGVFVYDLGGSVVSYNATLGSETAIGTLAGSYGGAGNGMAAWNDYVYFSTASTIARYGRLSASGPTMQFDYWVTGLSMSSLTNSDYPATRSVTYPNHVLLPHTDGRMYVMDYDGAQGRVHSFTTDSDGTNGSATFNDLPLPPGLMPMDAKSYGTSIAILLAPQAKYVSGAIPKSANSVLALWDTTPGNACYAFVPISEPLATALVNKNGELHVLCGNLDVGCKLLKYLGGYSFETLAVINEGSPPPACAADTNGNMIAWGSYGTYPATFAGVLSCGYRNPHLPAVARNNIAQISSVGTTPTVCMVKFIQRGRFPVMGWATDTGFGIDKSGGSGAYASYWRSQVFTVGSHFMLRRMKLPLTAAMVSGITIIPTIYVDDEVSNTVLLTINSTNYPASERIIDMQDLTVEGFSNFYLELQFTGTTEVAVSLPVTFEAEIYD